MIQELTLTPAEKSLRRLRQARRAFKPPPRLNLVEWADTYRRLAAKTSATPGRWRTSEQPVAYGPMLAVTERDTHTTTVMAGTQVVKTELLINTCGFFIHQDPSAILFVQPTQGAAEAFSKERIAPTVDATPVLRERILPPRSRDSGNTITHKDYPNGSLDLVGANSPTDLASRPKRIILCDEIDKYPPSAGAEGDPLKLAEERASTFRKLGRAKFVRTCSPTEKETSRIGREYHASDRRRCYLTCPHCGYAQILTWSHVVWSKDPSGEHLPETAGILCAGPDCGVIWSERDRITALDALATAPDHGWRQTRPFHCCEAMQTPARWDDRGRARCEKCDGIAPYGGHAGFHISKLYSKRHELVDLVREFLEAQKDSELLKKFTNTGLAELWEPQGRERIDGSGLIARAEHYGPDDLPNGVLVITGFCDVQGDRLEVQLIGWGAHEEAWPFQYTVINQDPAQPQAWTELDELLRGTFRTRDGRVLRIAAFAIDAGGNHGAQVFAFTNRRRGRRVFATFGRAGKVPVWPLRFKLTKRNQQYWPIGVDMAKDAISARLKIEPAENGEPRPGLIHFPDHEAFGPAYFEQLTAEYRETRRKMGQPYTVWVCPPGKRNEALDTFVGALCVRRSLPRRIQLGLDYAAAPSPPAAESSGEIPRTEPANPPASPVAPAAPASNAPQGWFDTPKEWL